MRWFALLTPIVLSAVVCGGSTAQAPETTGKIAFTRGADQVWMSADGSGQRPLTRIGAPVWSPEGRLAFRVLSGS
jgi:hypothetical protein